MTILNLTPDELLTTTRSVRKRLDLTRPVEPEVLRECLEIALQAPSGSNRQGWQFLVVTDAEKRRAIGEIYKRAVEIYSHSSGAAGKLFAENEQRAGVQKKVMGSVEYLGEHMGEVPVLLIPCINGRLDGLPGNAQAGPWGSILPATWSFMLAARARGLGTAWTTLHLMFEQEAAQVLEIPYEQVTQAALIPVAYSIGTDFRPAPRESLDSVVHWNKW